jgi:hypothetical protein
MNYLLPTMLWLCSLVELLCVGCRPLHPRITSPLQETRLQRRDRLVLICADCPLFASGMIIEMSSSKQSTTVFCVIPAQQMKKQFCRMLIRLRRLVENASRVWFLAYQIMQVQQLLVLANLSRAASMAADIIANNATPVPTASRRLPAVWTVAAHPSAPMGGSGAGARIAVALRCVSTGGSSTCARSAAAHRSAPTAGSRTCASSAEDPPSAPTASTGGAARSVGAPPFARTARTGRLAASVEVGLSASTATVASTAASVAARASASTASASTGARIAAAASAATPSARTASASRSAPRAAARPFACTVG